MYLFYCWNNSLLNYFLLYFRFTAACQFAVGTQFFSAMPQPQIFDQKKSRSLSFIFEEPEKANKIAKNIVTMFIRLSIAVGAWIKILRLGKRAAEGALHFRFVANFYFPLPGINEKKYVMGSWCWGGGGGVTSVALTVIRKVCGRNRAKPTDWLECAQTTESNDRNGRNFFAVRYERSERADRTEPIQYDPIRNEWVSWVSVVPCDNVC